MAIVICQRGGLDVAQDLPEATGVYRCFHCEHAVVLIGDQTALVLAGEIDSICHPCAIELSVTKGLFQEKDQISLDQLQRPRPSPR